MNYLLLILLLFCRYLADFTPLLTEKMLKAKAKGTPILEILPHGVMYGTLMWIVLLFFVTPQIAFILALLQIIIHTLIDTLKGKLTVWFPVTADNIKRLYWCIMGFDQFLHQAIIVLMVILSNML